MKPRNGLFKRLHRVRVLEGAMLAGRWRLGSGDQESNGILGPLGIGGEDLQMFMAQVDADGTPARGRFRWPWHGWSLVNSRWRLSRNDTSISREWCAGCSPRDIGQ